MILGWFGFIEPLTINGEVIKQEQVPSVSNGILFAYLLVPAILCVVSVISMYFYPLDGPEWKEKKFYLTELHIKKQEEFLQSLKLKLKPKDD